MLIYFELFGNSSLCYWIRYIKPEERLWFLKKWLKFSKALSYQRFLWDKCICTAFSMDICVDVCIQCTKKSAYKAVLYCCTGKSLHLIFSSSFSYFPLIYMLPQWRLLKTVNLWAVFKGSQFFSLKRVTLKLCPILEAVWLAHEFLHGVGDTGNAGTLCACGSHTNRSLQCWAVSVKGCLRTKAVCAMKVQC